MAGFFFHIRHGTLQVSRQYLKKRISIDLNRGENYSGRLLGQELGEGGVG